MTSTDITRSSKRWQVLTIGSLLIFLVDFGFFLSVPSQTKIFEDILCEQYYHAQSHSGIGYNTNNTGDDNNNACKIAPIQGELAVINGWKDTFDALPSILLSIPYGVLADHIGRKPCLLLCLFGVFLGEIWTRIVCWWPHVFPLRLVWLAGLFRVVGGGDLVTSSLICVIVADVFSESDRATALFRLSSVVILAEILAIPIGGALMSLKSPWVPFILGLFILMTGILLAAFLPETLVAKLRQKRSQQDEDEDEDEVAAVPQANIVAPEEPTASPPPPLLKTMAITITHQIREFIKSTTFIWRKANIILALFMFLTTSLSRQSTTLLLQYSSKRYHWTIAHASFLLSLRGSVNLANYLVFMPTMSAAFTTLLRMAPMQKDRRMSQISGLLTILGFLLIFAAQVPVCYIAGLVLLSLGSGFAVTTRSLATSLVPADRVSTLYSAAAVVQSVGALLAGPMFARLFQWGLKLGDDGGWLGLPFLLAASLFALATLAASFVSTSDGEEDGDGELEASEDERALLLHS